MTACNCEPGQKAFYWLLKLLRAIDRKGWEEGPTEDEVRNDINCFLMNHGYDEVLWPGIQDEFFATREGKDNY